MAFDSTFDGLKGAVIYKTNSEVYQTANYVDLMFSGAIVFSGYKIVRNIHAMATIADVSLFYKGFSTAFYGLGGFLMY